MTQFPTDLLIYFAVLLNPFSQTIILRGLINEMDFRDFATVYFKATALSFGVYLLFSLVGDILIANVFQIRLSSLRIFGGLIILTVAFRYLIQGAGSNLLFKGNLGDLVPDISLPFIIGPATIWICILIGRSAYPVSGMAGIGVILLLHWCVVALTARWMHNLQQRAETLVGKYLAILMRTNSLFIGAIGVEMIVNGVLELI